jgi:hypothetical protein
MFEEIKSPPMDKLTALKKQQEAENVSTNYVDNAYVSTVETTPAHNPRIVGRAIASVINYIVTDAFNLTEDEHRWLGLQLGKIMRPLESLPTEILLSSVIQEISTGEYSKRLFDYQPKPSIPNEFYSNVRMALLEDWVTVISSAILSSYPTVKPMVQAATVGQIYGMLSTLGLTNDIETSRKSTYLPNAVKYLINKRNSELLED